MSTERNQPDDFSELLSAYLDGELTAEEQAIVEQRLAESAEFRLLHDELRAVRSGLELLPRYTLKDDLASAVLRRAERAMLSSPAVSATGGDDSAAVALADQPTLTDRVVRGVKMFRWSIIAVAVAVLIMLFNPREQDKEQQVAMHRADDAVAPQSEMSAPPSEMIAAPGSGQYADSTPTDGAAVAHKRDATQASEAFAPEAATAPVPRPMLAEEKRVTGKLSEPSPVEKSIEQQQGGGGGLGGLGATAPARKSATVAGGKAKGGEAASMMADKKNEAAVDGLLRLQQASSSLGLSGIDDGTLIVHCDIRPEALKDGTFEKLLADQQIHLFGGTVEVNRGAAKALKAAAADQEVEVSNGADGPSAPPRNALTETLEEDRKPAARSFVQKDRANEEQDKKQATDAAGYANGEAGNNGEVTAYLVDASAEKVAATLAELNLRRDAFPAVAVSPSAVDALPEAAQRQIEMPAKAEGAAQTVDTSVPGPAGAAIEAEEAAPSADEAAPTAEAAADAEPRGSEVVGDQAKELKGEAGELQPMTKQTAEKLAGSRFRAKAGAAVRENVLSARGVDVAHRVSIDPAVLDFDGERDEADSKADGEAAQRRMRRGQVAAERAATPALVPAETRAPAAGVRNRSETGEPDLRNAPVVDPQPVARPGDNTSSREGANGQRPGASAREGQASSVRVLFLFRVVPEADAAR